MQGKLDKWQAAFFYIADSPHSSNGTYFKNMGIIKQKLKSFCNCWTRYNQPLNGGFPQ